MTPHSRGLPPLSSSVDLPLRLLGAWHVACAVAGAVTLLPVLQAAIRHPVGWLTLALLAVTVLVGVALLVGQSRVLLAAAVLQGAQVLAFALPGLVVWIVRVGLQLTVAVPPMVDHGIVSLRSDTTVFTIWGTGAQLPLGISVNLSALVAFAVVPFVPAGSRGAAPAGFRLTPVAADTATGVSAATAGAPARRSPPYWEHSAINGSPTRCGGHHRKGGRMTSRLVRFTTVMLLAACQREPLAPTTPPGGLPVSVRALSVDEALAAGPPPYAFARGDSVVALAVINGSCSPVIASAGFEGDELVLTMTQRGSGCSRSLHCSYYSHNVPKRHPGCADTSVLHAGDAGSDSRPVARRRRSARSLA